MLNQMHLLGEKALVFLPLKGNLALLTWRRLGQLVASSSLVKCPHLKEVSVLVLVSGHSGQGKRRANLRRLMKVIGEVQHVLEQMLGTPVLVSCSSSTGELKVRLTCLSSYSVHAANSSAEPSKARASPSFH